MNIPPVPVEPDYDVINPADPIDMDPMGTAAAESALRSLRKMADYAGLVTHRLGMLQDFEKIVLAQLKDRCTDPDIKSEAGRESWARRQTDFQDVVTAKNEMEGELVRIKMKHKAADLTVTAWMAKNKILLSEGKIQ